MLKSIIISFVAVIIIIQPGLCQKSGSAGDGILFHGVVYDGSTLSPVGNSQIFINRVFSTASGIEGSFAFYVNRKDTVLFTALGYKQTLYFVSDTLSGNEFVAGVYLKSDTISLGVVVIVPRYRNFKSEILNAKSPRSVIMENARYNVAISAYQGRTTQGNLGDPATNYAMMREKYKMDAYTKGGIPPDQMVSISPLLVIPAAYLLIKGLPEAPAPYKSEITDFEIDQIQKKYFETLNQRK